jgi:hypothetical protein
MRSWSWTRGVERRRARAQRVSLLGAAALCAVAGSAAASVTGASAATHFFPTTTTVTSSPGGPPGTVLTAVAEVSGHDPQGTVTFRLYGPDGSQCTGSPVMTTMHSPLHSKRALSDSFTANQPGVYGWRAWYSGDSDNIPSQSGCVTVVIAAAELETSSTLGAGIAASNQVPVPATGAASPRVPQTGAGSPAAPGAAGIALLLLAPALAWLARREHRRTV